MAQELRVRDENKCEVTSLDQKPMNNTGTTEVLNTQQESWETLSAQMAELYEHLRQNMMTKQDMYARHVQAFYNARHVNKM